MKIDDRFKDLENTNQIFKQIIKFCHQTIEKNKDVMKSDDEDRLMIDASRVLDIYKGVKDLHSGPNLIIADFPLNGLFKVWIIYLMKE